MPTGYIVRWVLFYYHENTMFIEFNPNPEKIIVGDCVVRAIAAIQGRSWESVYMDLAIAGLRMSDMPTANRVWHKYLTEQDFKRSEIPNSCPDCYTVKNFCEDHPYGEFILATGTHVIAVINGDYYDAWNSGSEIPIEYWSNDV